MNKEPDNNDNCLLVAIGCTFQSSCINSPDKYNALTDLYMDGERNQYQEVKRYLEEKGIRNITEHPIIAIPKL